MENADGNVESVAVDRGFPALFNSVVMLRAAVLLCKSACMVVLRVVGTSAFCLRFHHRVKCQTGRRNLQIAVELSIVHAVFMGGTNESYIGQSIAIRHA
jgi:hypothetical protein